MHESIVVVGLILQVLTLFTLTFFLYQLAAQQGRILLRLDDLERTKEKAADGQTRGLAVGTAVADFELPDLTGNNVSLTDFRGRRVLLIYWSPECGFCDMAAADLAKLQAPLQGNNTQPILVSFGDAAGNRKLAGEHGLTCPILLLENSPAREFVESKLFEFCGTPSAYLLDEQGRVAAPLAVGMDDVILLARESAARKPAVRKLPLERSRIEREGLKAGTPAPNFNLPDIHGESVSLEHFRGRKVLLVFTDPQCGPCDALAPDLARLHAKHGNNGLAVVMVGRGSPEQNKKKANQHGIAFPLVLQDRWKLSRQYGIFATPVAFLIGKDGVIMRDVAKGSDQIMTLAQQGLAST
jgi:peroxiredoxin